MHNSQSSEPLIEITIQGRLTRSLQLSTFKEVLDFLQNASKERADQLQSREFHLVEAVVGKALHCVSGTHDIASGCLQLYSLSDLPED